MKKIFLRIVSCFVLAFAWTTGLYAQAASIQQGTILHCFDWKYTDIEAELENIQKAGFTAVQTSPAQANYTGSTSWSTLYRPRDTEIGPNTLGTKAELQALCTAAHKLGLKVIVDVVANHTDGTLDWVADYWKNTDLYHTLGSVSNWNDRYQVTHGEIGMKDLKTEDSRVYSKFKTYVQALKAIGVDGCRWDAAKHIGLPSEGDNFWPNVIDKDMFNYGEILANTGGNDSKLLPEYMTYMSVTDAVYSTSNVLSSAKNGQASPYGYGNYSTTFSTNKVVYWGESHDTYCNRGDASDGVDQSVVDRAYAVAASHNQIPALYLSRPTGSGSSAQAGVKGSTHFTATAVAEVNKFHNAMDGKADWYTASGSVASITRKGGGAIVVNFRGSGSVNIANGGGYAVAGTYYDKVSGNKFTITSTTIEGTTDGTGIAVLYNDNEPSVTLSPAGETFTTETLSITATATNATNAWVQVGSGTKQTFTTSTTLTIGSGASYGSTITVNWGATNSDGTEKTGSETYKKRDPNQKFYIYYNNPNSWSTPHVYLYKGNVNNSWPGVAMTKGTTSAAINGSTDWWYYELPEAYVGGNVIFTDGAASGAAQYPGANEPGLQLSDETSNYVDGTTLGTTDVTPYNGGGGGGSDEQTYTPTISSENEISVFLKSSVTGATYKVWVWNANNNNTNYTGGEWPGEAMTEMGKGDDGLYYYKWTYTGSLTAVPTGLIFTKDRNKLVDNDLTFVNHGVFDVSGNNTEVTEYHKETPTSVTVTMTGLGTSYSSEYPLTFSEDDDLQAYIASGIVKRNGKLVIYLARIYNVPAKTGLILRRTDTSTDAVQIEVGTAKGEVSNLLVPVLEKTTLEPTSGNNTNYIFSMSKNAFTPLSKTISMPANKAYLPVPAKFVPTDASGAKQDLPYLFDDEDDVTGIELLDLKATATADAWYTLSGQKIGTPVQKGIYIHNGRKVVVK